MAVRKQSKTGDWGSVPINSLLYGGPGAGKTTLANTANKPVMWDIEKGSNRAVQRAEDTWSIDTYEDMNDMLKDPDLINYNTIIIDTAEAFCQLLIDNIVNNKIKYPGATLEGNTFVLSKQGYAQLGRMFRLFFEDIKKLNKDLVFIAHEKPKTTDYKKRPFITGNISYQELMKSMTLVGLVYKTHSDYFVDFSTNDHFETKDSGALGCVKIGNLDPTRGAVVPAMANIIDATRTRLKNTATAGAAINEFLAEIVLKIEGAKTAKDFNELVAESQTWDLAYRKDGKQKIHDAATLCGMFWDNDLRGYRAAVAIEAETKPDATLPAGDDQHRKIAAFIDTIGGIDPKQGQKLIDRMKEPMNAEQAESAIKYMQDWLTAKQKNG